MSSRLEQPPARPTTLASCPGVSTLRPHHKLLMPTTSRPYKTPKPSAKGSVTRRSGVASRHIFEAQVRHTPPRTRPTAMASCTGISTLRPHHKLLVPTTSRPYKTPKPSFKRRCNVSPERTLWLIAKPAKVGTGSRPSVITEGIIKDNLVAVERMATDNRPADLHRPTDRPTDRPTGRPAGRPADRPTDRPTDHRPTDRPTDRSVRSVGAHPVWFQPNREALRECCSRSTPLVRGGGGSRLAQTKKRSRERHPHFCCVEYRLFRSICPFLCQGPCSCQVSLTSAVRFLRYAPNITCVWR